MRTTSFKNRILSWSIFLLLVIAVPCYSASTDYKVTNDGEVYSYDLITKGPWIDSRAYATLELANTAAYNAGKLLVVSQNHTLTANTILTASVMRIPGGSFTKESTYTLHFSGKFVNPDNGQAFIGFTTGVTFGAGSVKEVYPDWWGVNTTPGTTDMTDEIQSAIQSYSSPHIRLLNSNYKITGLTIPASMSDFIMEGHNDSRTLTTSVISGGAGVTLFTFGHDCLNITFRRITFYNADIAFSLPDAKMLTNIIFEECTFLTISDKAFQVLDDSKGADGGIVKGTFRNCNFYDCKYGFYSIQNAMVNNLHFDNCSWESPKNGGYQVYIGGCDNSTISTNISIENSLFNGTTTTTSIPIYIGRVGTVSLKSVHFADWGLDAGNAGLELIKLEGDVSDYGVLSLLIENCDIYSSRGECINDVALAGIGTLMLIANDIIASRAGDPIVTNVDYMSNFIAIGNRFQSDTRIARAQYNFIQNNLISGTPLPLAIATLTNTATPSVLRCDKWLTGGTTTITNFTEGTEGQVIQIISEHAITITHGTNIFLNGSANFVMAATDTLTLIQKADGKWYEIGRSDN